MKPFNLEEWLKDKSKKVITRDRREVRIICTDANKDCISSKPIVAILDGVAIQYSLDGYKNSKLLESDYDLFFADEELTELQKTLEEDCDCYVKLYNDSNTREELREWIKCWCHRIIDLARKEIESKTDKNFADDEEELTDFESDLFTAFSDAWQDYLLGESVNVAEWVKEHSKDLLESARKELEENYYTKVLDDRMVLKSELHATNLQTAYDIGKQDALKDLPKWKNAKESRCLPDGVVKMDEDGKIIYSDAVWEGEYYIMLQSLESLPKER